MVKNSAFITCFLLLLTLTAFGQKDRYMVFFADKDTAAYSTESPTIFLSDRAIERRQKQNISVTPQDFPIRSTYSDSLAVLGVDVYFESRWFNAVLVEMSTSLASEVLSRDFVSGIEYIAAGSVLSYSKDEVVIPEEFMEPPQISANSDSQNAKLAVKNMHADGYSGEGMLIAVFDNGYKGVNLYNPFEHVFDNERVVATQDFVGNSGNVYQYGTHGTQVFSDIAARYKEDMLGTAPDASYILCVTEETSSEYRVEEYNWLLAAEFADSIGVDVINNSLGYSYGFDDESMDYEISDLDGKTTVISRAAAIAAEKGILVVTSAGNEGSYSWKKITPPADVEDVLSVGSIRLNGDLSSFSSVGPTADGRIKPDVVAMGSSAAVVKGGGTIATSSGTSFSSPQIAGFAACIWQANPHWTNKEVIEAIKYSGNNVSAPDNSYGYGVPNYLTLINNNALFIDQLLDTELNVFPNPFRDNKIVIDFMGQPVDRSLEISITDTQGKAVFDQRITRKNTPDQIEVTFNTQNTGVYFLRIKSRKTEKVIKLIKI
ncbi:MAG: S8 family serine peptidase [Cyclobacteriaceae bacterium]|uniref:S8 family serine peptidase n=1 Tax=Nonlabens ulvanivorans TaxID=906888 RepID=UPI003291F1D4